MKQYFNDEQQKQSFVSSVFSGITNRYDIMNDLMSAGLHRFWKKEFVSHVAAGNNNYLDLATGSGDIAISLIKKLRDAQLNGKQCANASITCADQEQGMLDVAKNKMADANLLTALPNGVNFVCTSAEKMPMDDETFDFITVSFGIRNFSNIEESLSEIYRVAKKGATFLCLEFSPQLSNDYAQKMYNQYSKLIPIIGQAVTNNRVAYQYLVDSIANFPSKQKFAKMIQNAGFSFVDYTELTFGICNIHIAKK